MHWSDTFVTTLAILPAVIEAHGGVPFAPKLFGRHSVEQLRARNAFAVKPRAPQPAPVVAPQPVARVDKRQNIDGQCGPGFGACAAGYCCSAAGWCGLGTDYCPAPDCQFKYGSGCDTLKVPSGPATSNIPRTKVGSVPYGGAGVYDCINNGDVAITYDDGPFSYTGYILDLLDKYNAKATFFITGNNLGKGEIDTTQPWPSYIQRMYASGHQIASHTWGHQDLSIECNQAQRKVQMYNNEIAFNNILGRFPTYMRPPYSSCDRTTNGNCESDMAALGYHIIYFDLDTEDYLLDDANLIQQAKNNFVGNLTTGTPALSSKLSIAHDIHYQTAYNLTEYMLQTVQSQGFRAVTVGECLGDPPANWYRTVGGGTVTSSGTKTLSVPLSTSSFSASKLSSTVSTTPSSLLPSIVASSVSKSASRVPSKSASTISSKPASTSSSKPTSNTLSKPVSPSNPVSTPKSSTRPSATSSGTAKPTIISTDATCGGTAGYTCQGSAFGNCCSVNGWCGSTSDYCGSGCQAAYGSCGTNSQSAPAPSSTATKRASQDGSCGGTSGYTCQGSNFGNCCSQYGWCGTTSGHCSTGCQPAFGTCS